MIIECDETSRPSTRKSDRIISAIKMNPPKSSRTHHNPSKIKNDLRKFNIEELSKDDFENILKTEVRGNYHESVNKDKYYIKNMNLYRHIISNTQSTESDLDWILDLRTKIDTGFIIQNTKRIKCIEPSFYKKDLEKLARKKSIEKKMEQPISLKENVQSIDHIIKNRLGEKANIHQIKFELNLRKYETEKDFRNNSNKIDSDKIKNFNASNKIWKEIPFIPKSKLFSSYKDNKFGYRSEKNFNKDYLIEKEIQTKENKKNNANTANTEQTSTKKIKAQNPKFGLVDEYLGENKSMKPYTVKYRVKNAASIQHMLKKGTNAQALFQSGLRDY